MSDLNLDLNAIRQRNADIYAALLAGSISEPMRQHFTEDVPDLIADVRRLTAERDGVREELARQAATVDDLTATAAMRTRDRAELTAILDDTRARMRAAEAVVSAAHAWANAWDDCMTEGDEEETASLFHAAENALLIALRPGQEA